MAILKRVQRERVDGLVERTLTRLRRIDATSPPVGINTVGAGAVGINTVSEAEVTAPLSVPHQARAEQPKTLADLYAEHRARLVRLALLLVDERRPPPRTWCRRRSPGCTATGQGCVTSTPRSATCALRWSDGSRSVLRRRRTARDYVPPHQVNARSAESLAMLSAEHQEVVDALGGLPGRQREVLVLRYYGGLSEAEIAEATGISRGAVKSTASRALDAVAKSMNAAASLVSVESGYGTTPQSSTQHSRSERHRGRR